MTVCQAVQHAHQKGIIHRDIKPSNVLVAEVDGRPAPKIIDFGVAKATGFDLTNQSLGNTGAIVGTPTYMSPEQADPSSMDIDTRTDIYALGVILYELLAGSPPLEPKQFRRGAFLEMLRMVREVDPPIPSSKVSTSDVLASIAASRAIEPAHLQRALVGDLDWIVMKAIEKDRGRRYETANGFAADILRHLANEPVLAAPPSTVYRLRKLVRKHRGAVTAACLIVVALLAGIVGTTLGLIEANTRRREAETNLRFASRGNAILGSVFEGLDPQASYETVSELRNALRDNLNKAVTELDGSALGDPLIVATMQYTLGVSLTGLGEYPQAIAVLEKAALTRKARLGPDHPDTLATKHRIADAHWIGGSADLALPLSEETYRLRKARLGPDHPDTLTSMNQLAFIYSMANKFDVGIPLAEEVLRLRKAKLGPDHKDTLMSMNDLAGQYELAKKSNLAMALHETTLNLTKAKLGPDHLDTLVSMYNLAVSYESAGKLALALPLFEETLRIERSKLGTDHPQTLITMVGAALAYQSAGKLDLALPLFEETLKIRRIRLGTDHPHTLFSMGDLAAAYRRLGKADLAVPLLVEMIKTRSARLGPDHSDTIDNKGELAQAYVMLGKADLALPLFDEVIKVRSARLGPDHSDTLVKKEELAQACVMLGKADLALPLFDEVIKARRAKLGRDHPDTINTMVRTSGVLLKATDYIKAEGLLRETLALGEKTQPRDRRTLYTRLMLGRALLGQQKYTEAEPLLLSGYEGMKKLLEHEDPLLRARRIPEALDWIIDLYTAINKPDELKKWRVERAEYPAAKPPRNDPK